MQLRKTIMTLTLALMFSVFAFGGTALAETVTYDAASTGYTYMGNMGVNTTNTSYFIAGPTYYLYGGADYWGYSWISFDSVGTETVDSACLEIELLGVGSMVIENATEEHPGVVDIYSVDVDTDALGDEENTSLRETLKDTLLETTADVDDYTMTSNGTYSIDITGIYNDWVTGGYDDYTLILVSYSENTSTKAGAVGCQFASTDGTLGTAVNIETSSVPVPAAVWLLGSGLFGVLGLRRRNRKAA